MDFGLQPERGRLMRAEGEGGGGPSMDSKVSGGADRWLLKSNLRLSEVPPSEYLMECCGIRCSETTSGGIKMLVGPVKRRLKQLRGGNDSPQASHN